MAVKFSVDEKLIDSKIQIAPMLLIVLVENAFKYGVSYANPSEIYLKLEVNSNEIEFLTKNQITPQTENYGKKGMGLVNLTKRLQLIYPEKHEFTIRNENNEYAANLKIKI
jgi:LytS/YehU family sensor histidine kinase